MHKLLSTTLSAEWEDVLSFSDISGESGPAVEPNECWPSKT